MKTEAEVRDLLRQTEGDIANENPWPGGGLSWPDPLAVEEHDRMVARAEALREMLADPEEGDRG